jgi:hypothetical protein
VNPSPPSGLLVAAGVDLDKLSRRCRTMGVEVLREGLVHYARSAPPGRRSKSDPPTSAGTKSGASTAKSGVRAQGQSVITTRRKRLGTTH